MEIKSIQFEKKENCLHSQLDNIYEQPKESIKKLMQLINVLSRLQATRSVYKNRYFYVIVSNWKMKFYTYLQHQKNMKYIGINNKNIGKIHSQKTKKHDEEIKDLKQ